VKLKNILVDESLADFMEAERNASDDQYALALAELDKVYCLAFPPLSFQSDSFQTCNIGRQ